MYRIFLILVFSTLLSAELINGVSVVVKGEIVTLEDVNREMKASGVNQKSAIEILIRKKLEELEIQERKISVTTADIYADIKQIATANNLSVEDFYNAVRESNGLTSEQLKEKTREKLLSQRLYSSIAYMAASEPSEDEIKEYYELHKDKFMHPNSFDVTIYSSPDKTALQKKIASPMFLSKTVKIEETKLFYDNISPQLARLLEETKPSTFTQIIQDSKNGFISIYLKSMEKPKESSAQIYKDKISNLIVNTKREQVLGDYFAKLKNNSDIKIIRETTQDVK